MDVISRDITLLLLSYLVEAILQCGPVSNYLLFDIVHMRSTFLNTFCLTQVSQTNLTQGKPDSIPANEYFGIWSFWQNIMKLPCVVCCEHYTLWVLEGDWVMYTVHREWEEEESGGDPHLIFLPWAVGDGLFQPCTTQRTRLLVRSTVFCVSIEKQSI